MTRARHSQMAILAVAISALLLCLTPTSRPTAEALPQRLDDRTFWTLVIEFSEPNGFFRSDNLVSNETVFQHVIPTLQQTLGQVSAYVGVGPDQNFTYIASLKPRISFIVDIRRQNMLLHLMYKALIELSPTREEFLSRLFSRPAPARNAANDTADALLAAFQEVEPDPVAFERNRADIYSHLQHTHGFALTRADLAGIDYVFRAFYSGGPEIRYSFGRGPGWQPFPSYRDLMIADDGDGMQRSYLASEEIYRALRDIQERNLIVPLVGDFAGPKALRSVARYLDLHRATVSVFYTSNVEQYLFKPGDTWQRFYDNVAALPITGRSTFIRAFFNNQGRVMRIIPDPGPTGAIPIGPRSQTLLNPISVLLGAYSEGHISSYYDVIELSSPK
ncbi:MAG TPA: hypothetical protein VEL51_13480 [Vicinamibacterales bacterium]|nr:hypothetical protein [Vicinamibacterales bacterium]